MAAVELTAENFDEIVGGNNFVIVDFWATWCGPCQQFGPIFDATSEKHEDIVFAKVNTEEQQELAGHFQVRSVPTLMIFRDQIVIYSQPGALMEPQFEDLIAKARELDMDKVREEIAKQQADGTQEG